MNAEIEINEDALTIAHLAVEDALVDFRDNRISSFTARNGLVIRERDGRESHVIRLGTRDGLYIGIRAYLTALAEGAPKPKINSSRVALGEETQE